MAARTKRSEQIPLLKDAAVAIAERQGEPRRISSHEVKEVDLGGLYFWISGITWRVCRPDVRCSIRKDDGIIFLSAASHFGSTTAAFIPGDYT